MVDKMDNGGLTFIPKCSKSTFQLQLDIMHAYLEILEQRAGIEGIEV